MASALASFRIDYDQVHIKKIDDSDNPILKKRRQKKQKHSSVTMTTHM